VDHLLGGCGRFQLILIPPGRGGKGGVGIPRGKGGREGRATPPGIAVGGIVGTPEN